MAVQLTDQGRPIRRSHRKSDSLARQRVFRQLVHLGIREHLQAVLEAPQKHVGGAQLRGDTGGEQAAAVQNLQRRQQRLCLQASVAATANQLEGLHDEFNFADAAGAELHVVCKLAPLDFLLDERLHLAQALEHAIVEIAAENERPDRGCVQLGVTLRRGDGPCLHICISLPVASVPRQIVLE